ncbi:MAG: transposase [Bryobacterales bacterium]|nr:transposase [Bryobacterales bacterium]
MPASPSRIPFSTLARANRKRSWRMHLDLTQRLIARARALYADEDPGLDLDETVSALDSSAVDLCLSVFPWATFRATKAAVKLHTLLDLSGSIPSVIHISDGKLHDVNVLDLLVPERGAIYVMDRAYVDSGRLYQLHQAGASFITRAKKKLKYHRVYSAAKDHEAGI